MAAAVLLGRVRAARRVEVNTASSQHSVRESVSEQSWDDLFDFLDPGRKHKQGEERDREAERRYREIVRKLVYFFAGRGCTDAEDLAIESLLRVAAKCRQVDITTAGDCTRYFYGVARNVLHEWHRENLRHSKTRDALQRELTRLGAQTSRAWKGEEALDRCLDRCLIRLTVRARRLILDYYGAERTAKIERHRLLADQFGKSLNALRIEIHRIRKTLRECVTECAHPEGDHSGLGPPVSRGA
jgi:RNA polymerase sigma factor (sigma-70 family)